MGFRVGKIRYKGSVSLSRYSARGIHARGHYFIIRSSKKGRVVIVNVDSNRLQLCEVGAADPREAGVRSTEICSVPIPETTGNIYDILQRDLPLFRIRRGTGNCQQ